MGYDGEVSRRFASLPVGLHARLRPADVAKFSLDRYRFYAVSAGACWGLFAAQLGYCTRPAGNFEVDPFTLTAALLASLLWSQLYVFTRFPGWRPRGVLTGDLTEPLAWGLVYLAWPLTISPLALVPAIILSILARGSFSWGFAAGTCLMGLCVWAPWWGLVAQVLVALAISGWCHQFRAPLTAPVEPERPTRCRVVLEGREALIELCGSENFLPFETKLLEDMKKMALRHGGRREGPHFHFPSAEFGRRASRDFEKYLNDADRQLRDKGLPQLSPVLTLSVRR